MIDRGERAPIMIFDDSTSQSAYRFMSTMAGNRAGFEEAARALFAGKQARFNEMIGSWPADVRDHAKKTGGRGVSAVARMSEATFGKS